MMILILIFVYNFYNIIISNLLFFFVILYFFFTQFLSVFFTIYLDKTYICSEPNMQFVSYKDIRSHLFPYIQDFHGKGLSANFKAEGSCTRTCDLASNINWYE